MMRQGTQPKASSAEAQLGLLPRSNGRMHCLIIMQQHYVKKYMLDKLEEGIHLDRIAVAFAILMSSWLPFPISATSGIQHQPKALHLGSFSLCFRSSVDKAAATDDTFRFSGDVTEMSKVASLPRAQLGSKMSAGRELRLILLMDKIFTFCAKGHTPASISTPIYELTNFLNSA